MLTNEELKKKISQIISEYCCPYGKTHKQLYGDDRMCYSKMNFAECNPITECTDALISAWIGDVSKYNRLAYEVRCNLTSVTRYIHNKNKQYNKKYKELAEKAVNNLLDLVNNHTQQAEKELAEEGKDD